MEAEYDATQAKFCASLLWFVCRISEKEECDVPPEITSPLENSSGNEVLVRPAVVEYLRSGLMYFKVATNIYERPFTSFQDLLHYLTKNDIFLTYDNGEPISERDLQQKFPFEMNAHICLMDGVLQAYINNTATTQDFINSIKNFSSFNASREMPFGVEGAIVLWINKINTSNTAKHLMKHHTPPHQKAHDGGKIRIRKDQVMEAKIFPSVQTMYKALHDGRSLLSIVLFYFKDAVKVGDINLSSVLSDNERLVNIELFRSLCAQHICTSVFALRIEDFYYASDRLKNNFLALLCEILSCTENISNQPVTEEKPEQHVRPTSSSSSSGESKSSHRQPLLSKRSKKQFAQFEAGYHVEKKVPPKNEDILIDDLELKQSHMVPPTHGDDKRVHASSSAWSEAKKTSKISLDFRTEVSSSLRPSIKGLPVDGSAHSLDSNTSHREDQADTTSSLYIEKKQSINQIRTSHPDVSETKRSGHNYAAETRSSGPLFSESYNNSIKSMYQLVSEPDLSSVDVPRISETSSFSHEIQHTPNTIGNSAVQEEEDEDALSTITESSEPGSPTLAPSSATHAVQSDVSPNIKQNLPPTEGIGTSYVIQDGGTIENAMANGIPIILQNSVKSSTEHTQTSPSVKLDEGRDNVRSSVQRSRRFETEQNNVKSSITRSCNLQESTTSSIVDIGKAIHAERYENVRSSTSKPIVSASISNTDVSDHIDATTGNELRYVDLNSSQEVCSMDAEAKIIGKFMEEKSVKVLDDFMQRTSVEVHANEIPISSSAEATCSSMPETSDMKIRFFERQPKASQEKPSVVKSLEMRLINGQGDRTSAKRQMIAQSLDDLSKRKLNDPELDGKNHGLSSSHDGIERFPQEKETSNLTNLLASSNTVQTGTQDLTAAREVDTEEESDSGDEERDFEHERKKQSYFNSVSYDHWPFTTEKTDTETTRKTQINGETFYLEQLNILRNSRNSSSMPNITSWLKNNNDKARLPLEEREERLRKIQERRLLSMGSGVTTTWSNISRQQQQLKQAEENIKSLQEDVPLSSRLAALRMQLEEKRRQFEEDKKTKLKEWNEERSQALQNAFFVSFDEKENKDPTMEENDETSKLDVKNSHLTINKSLSPREYIRQKQLEKAYTSDTTPSKKPTWFVGFDDGTNDNEETEHDQNNTEDTLRNEFSNGTQNNDPEQFVKIKAFSVDLVEARSSVTTHTENQSLSIASSVTVPSHTKMEFEDNTTPAAEPISRISYKADEKELPTEPVNEYAQKHLQVETEYKMDADQSNVVNLPNGSVSELQNGSSDINLHKTEVAEEHNLVEVKPEVVMQDEKSNVEIPAERPVPFTEERLEVIQQQDAASVNQISEGLATVNLDNIATQATEDTTPVTNVEAEQASPNKVLTTEQASPNQGTTWAFTFGEEVSESPGMTPEQMKKRERFIKNRQKQMEEKRAKREAEMEKKRRKQEEERLRLEKEEQEKQEKLLLKRSQSDQNFTRSHQSFDDDDNTSYNSRQPSATNQRKLSAGLAKTMSPKQVPQQHERRKPATDVIRRVHSASPDLFASAQQQQQQQAEGSEEKRYTEYNGPSAYQKPSGKSNRKIIQNAISHCCLSGAVNRDSKEKCLEAIEKSESHHFLVLFRDPMKFRGVYEYYPENELVTKIYGVGPKNVTSKMTDKFFRYNSGGKAFNALLMKSLSIQCDGMSIKKELWEKKQTPLSSTPKAKTNIRKKVR